MKLIQFFGGIAMYAAITSTLVSCQKDDTATVTNAAIQSSERVSGVVEDDPARVAKIPMIVSSSFLANSKNLSEPTFEARGKPDNIPPNVSITAPSSSSTVTGTVQIRANATDNIEVSLVSLSVDGNAVTSSANAPYVLPWNSASLPNGAHTLTVTARDAAGNTKSTSVQVIGSNAPGADVTNPTVNITSPSNNASVSGVVNIGVTAVDNVGVNAVNFQVDGAVIATDNSAPYSVAWNSATVSSGVHTLSVQAVDAAGNSSTQSIQITVNTVVIPPTSIPSSFELLTPTPGNQGGEGSCVAFAVGYGARSIEQFYRTNATAYTLQTNIFSPEYIYNQIKFSDCGSGTAFTIALDLIKNQGVSSWESMPYSDVNGCSVQPNASQIANASAYKISSYVTIPNTDRVAIKTMIASKHPVIINIIADDSFINAGPGFTWRTYSGSGSLPHAILICGYDDARNAYKIMNSFGTGWGDAGFTWIDYDFFTQKSAYYTYVMQ